MNHKVISAKSIVKKIQEMSQLELLNAIDMLKPTELIKFLGNSTKDTKIIETVLKVSNTNNLLAIIEKLPKEIKEDQDLMEIVIKRIIDGGKILKVIQVLEKENSNLMDNKNFIMLVLSKFSGIYTHSYQRKDEVIEIMKLVEYNVKNDVDVATRALDSVDEYNVLKAFEVLGEKVRNNEDVVAKAISKVSEEEVVKIIKMLSPKVRVKEKIKEAVFSPWNIYSKEDMLNLRRLMNLRDREV